MTSSNQFKLIRAREAVIGERALAGFREVGVNDYTVKPTDGYETEQTITGDRAFEFLLRTGTEISGNIPFHLAFGHQWAFELGFLNQFAKTPEADGVEITGVTAVDDTFATSTGVAFAEGDIWRASGMAAANNGRFVALAGSSTDALVVGAGGTLADETPGAAARLKFVGKQGALGDISAVADGLVSASSAFAAYDLAPGDSIVIGGPATSQATRFDAAAGYNNRVALVVEKQDDKLTLTDLGAGWATDDGAGKTIWILYGDEMDYGDDTTIVTDTHEFSYGGQATPLHVYLTAIAGNTLAIDIQRLQPIIATLGVLGFTDGNALSATDPAPLSKLQRSPMTAGEHVGAVMVGGQRRPAGSKMKSATFNFNNNLQADGPMEGLTNEVYYAGDFDLTVDFTAQFGDERDWQAFRAGAQTQLLIPIINNDQGYIMRVWAGQYVDGDIAPGGRNQIRDFTGQLRCLRDPATGKVVTFTQIEDFGRLTA